MKTLVLIEVVIEVFEVAFHFDQESYSCSWVFVALAIINSNRSGKSIPQAWKSSPRQWQISLSFEYIFPWFAPVAEIPERNLLWKLHLKQSLTVKDENYRCFIGDVVFADWLVAVCLCSDQNKPICDCAGGTLSSDPELKRCHFRGFSF